jgi:hypothetical protein
MVLCSGRLHPLSQMLNYAREALLGTNTLAYLTHLGFNLSNGVTDALESSSILIYSELHTGFIFAQMGLDAVLIKW